MWGNSLGWLISACLAVALGGWLWMVATGSSPTPATAFGTNPQTLAALALPALPEAALGPREHCDAGPLYRRAIAGYEADRTIYEDFSRLGKLTSKDVPRLQAIEWLVEASKCDDMKLFATSPGELVTYARTKKPLEALEVLSRVCVDRLGLLNQKAGKPDEAMKYFRAGVALGNHLCNERITYAELQLGMEILSKSVAAMASAAQQNGDADLAKALLDYSMKRQAYVTQSIDPILRVVRTIDPKIVGKQTGDVFEIAQHSKERMWRVEAIFAAGRVRYFAGEGGTAGNQRFANEMLRKMAEEDSDPVIRLAAEKARDLTVEEHRMQ